MTNKIAVFIVGIIFVSQATFGALRWGSGSSVILDFDGNPVPSSSEELSPFMPLDPTVGAFAQLIRILSGNQPYAFGGSPSGINTDFEEVVDTMYSGQYDDLLETAGAFPYSIDGILNASSFNGFYYVRVFDAPQDTLANWNLGTAAPVPADAGYYFQSSVYEYTHNDLSESIFDFGSGQTLNVVPEPGTMLLVVAGLGVLAYRRKIA